MISKIENNHDGTRTYTNIDGYSVTVKPDNYAITQLSIPSIKALKLAQRVDETTDLYEQYDRITFTIENPQNIGFDLINFKMRLTISPYVCWRVSTVIEDISAFRLARRLGYKTYTLRVLKDESWYTVWPFRLVLSEEQAIQGYKCLRSDLTSSYTLYVFELGKKFSIDPEEKAKICQSGFHFALEPIYCFWHYDLYAKPTALLKVKAWGEIDCDFDCTKICSQHLFVDSRLSKDEWIRKCIGTFIFVDERLVEFTENDHIKFNDSGSIDVSVLKTKPIQ